MDRVAGTIAAMRERQTSAAIAELFLAAAAELGFDSFSFMARRGGDGRRGQSIATNYPATWRARVVERHYLDVDPTVCRARHSPMPFAWSELQGSRTLLPAQRQIFDEAAACGLRHGFTVPVHMPGGGDGLVAFAGDMATRDFDRALDHHRHELHLLALHFHALTEAALRREQTACRHGAAATEESDVTGREAECLMWTARGKSAWETAAVLGISERTVNFHVENARRKLNAQTKTQAVVQAMMRNLIRP